MDILIRNKLNRKETAEVKAFLSACTEKKGLMLSFPFGDADASFFLCHEQSTLVSVLVLCRIDDLSFECIAWTRPENRRAGYFKALWNEAVKTLRGTAPAAERKNIRVTFITDNLCPAARKVLRTLKAKKQAEELTMSADLSGFKSRTAADSLFLFRKKSKGSGNTAEYEVISADHADVPVLSFSILPARESSTCYLYSFSVRKDLRGRGYGSRIFPLILQFLKSRGYSGLMLQVSSSNKAAVKIYRNSGLTAGVRLTYYEITI